MPFDVAVALVVLLVLFGTMFAIIRWARGAPPYDDGMGGSLVSYVPEPDDPARLPGEPARTGGREQPSDDADRARSGS